MPGRRHIHYTLEPHQALSEFAGIQASIAAQVRATVAGRAALEEKALSS
jgi:hypothetical protein